MGKPEILCKLIEQFFRKNGGFFSAKDAKLE